MSFYVRMTLWPEQHMPHYALEPHDAHTTSMDFDVATYLLPSVVIPAVTVVAVGIFLYELNSIAAAMAQPQQPQEEEEEEKQQQQRQQQQQTARASGGGAVVSPSPSKKKKKQAAKKKHQDDNAVTTTKSNGGTEIPFTGTFVAAAAWTFLFTWSLPAVGIVQHGVLTMAADRYHYLPALVVAPVAAVLFARVFSAAKQTQPKPAPVFKVS